MSEILKFRDGSWDENVWKSVAVENEYRLARRFEPTDTVLDIGGHIGAFAYKCLDLGAGRVVTVEPDEDNLLYLRHNLLRACRATDRLVAVCAAAWSHRTVLKYSKVWPNTGGTCVHDGGEIPVAAVAIDDLIQLAVGDGPLAMLKLDCEGAEWTILPACKRIGAVRYCIGEWHGGTPDRPEKLLRDLGFDHVEVCELVTSIGLWHAWRDGDRPPHRD